MDVTNIANTTNITSNISSYGPSLQYHKQHLASLALQFMGSCLVGVLGCVYTVRALNKVCSSSKILHKYVPIPSMLVAGLLICVVILPLRMFIGIMLLSGEDVYSICLAALYAEQVCEAASLISALILSFHRLQRVYCKVYNSFTDNTNQPSLVAVTLSWLVPLLALAVYTYLCTSTAVPPWLLGTCTHKFPKYGKIPSGVTILMDISLPLAVGVAMITLIVVYSAIVYRMRSKTCTIHPSTIDDGQPPPIARKYSLSVQR